MSIDALVPLREAARRIGITDKTWRNQLSRARSGLKSRALPPTMIINGRRFVTEEDLTSYLAHAGSNGTPPELAAALEQFARMFPAEAQLLRALISNIPPNRRKAKLRCVPAAPSTPCQPEDRP